MLKELLLTLGMSMLPVVELRGGIPFGLSQGLSLPVSIAVSILGNMLPVPFIIVFIRRIFKFLKSRITWMGNIIGKLEARAMNKADMVYKYEMLGLVLLVAIPLPGTGAWTGALVAALLDIRLRRALPSIFLGVLIAAAIISVVSYGVIQLV